MNSIAESLSFTFINWSTIVFQWMCCYPNDCLEKGQTGTARRLRHCEEKRNRNPLGFSRWTIQDEGMREERASVITRVPEVLPWVMSSSLDAYGGQWGHRSHIGRTLMCSSTVSATVTKDKIKVKGQNQKTNAQVQNVTDKAMPRNKHTHERIPTLHHWRVSI